MSCDVGDEYNDVENLTIRRARKEHVCCACKETIRRGDQYEYLFALFEGDVSTYKRCLRCRAVYQELVKHMSPDDDQGIAWALDCGHTWEDRHNEPMPEHVARMAFLTAEEAQRELAPKAEARP